MHSQPLKKGLPEAVFYEDGIQITVYENSRASAFYLYQFKSDIYIYNNTFRNNPIYGRLAPLATIVEEMNEINL